MLKKITYSAGIAFSILILLLSSASAAISFVYSEGVWGRVDDGYDGIKFDVVGVVGVDPDDTGPAYWGTDPKTTRDDTLIRNATVCTHDPDGDEDLTEWTGTSPAVYTGLGSHTFGPGACDSQGFFISEYIEGDGSPTTDAIELYNNMGQELDISKFSIQIYRDGSSSPDVNIPLSGMITGDLLAEDATLVISSAAIDGVTGEFVRTALAFDGNDAVALVRDYIADDEIDDGWWNGPDGERDSATGLVYATGPTGLDPQGQGADTGDRLDQNPPEGDWNQVRYGYPSGNPNTFYYQSGLAFQGITTAENAEFEEDQAFLAGKFCHVNNPISKSNSFTYTNLTLDLYNVDCGDYAVAPFPPERMTFVYPVTFEETYNSGSCKYTSPADNPCNDAVTFGNADAEFTCFYEGGENTYKVAIVGFMPVGQDESCSEKVYTQSGSTGIFISEEGSTNCGCLFAMVTESNPTAVDLIFFDAESVPEGVKVSWETATETDNLGFNLYRADSLASEKVQLNDTLILPNVPPGSPFGATYEFVDTGATAFQTYFYWLEDIDTSGEITLHGPVGVTRP